MNYIKCPVCGALLSIFEDKEGNLDKDKMGASINNHVLTHTLLDLVDYLEMKLVDLTYEKVDEFEKVKPR